MNKKIFYIIVGILSLLFIINDIFGLIKSFIPQVVILIVIIYLFIREERIIKLHSIKQIKQTKDELQRTNQITQLLLGNFEFDKPLEKLLKTIIENITRGVGFDEAFIYLLEGSEMTGILRCIATRGVLSLKGIDRFTLSFLNEEEAIIQVLSSREPKVIQDADKDNILSKELVSSLKMKQFLLVPMHIMNRILGLVILGNTSFKKTITGHDINSARLIVNQASVALHIAQLYNKIQDMTINDELTGVYNHRYFKDVIRKELDLANRYLQPLSLSIVDIDNFKHYNDTNGHLAGDNVLRQVAQILSQGVRRTDIVARYGGEEFALILPATDKEGAMIILEKLRRDIETYPFPNAEKQPSGKVTISLGVATFPNDAKEVREFIEIADKGMYIAKSSGKNKIGIHPAKDILSEEIK